MHTRYDMAKMQKLCNLNVLHGCRDCDSILFRNKTGWYCLPNKLNVCQLSLSHPIKKRNEDKNHLPKMCAQDAAQVKWIYR